MKLKLFILLFAIFAGLMSCTKDITVNLPKAERKIVIEGAIEQGQFPWVVVTRSSPYFEPLNLNLDSAGLQNLLTNHDSSLLKIVVINAVITVTDGFITDSLKIGIDRYQLPYIKYTGSKIIGQVGKTYTLKVIADGKTYTAIASIPNPVAIDSVTYQFEANSDSLGLLYFYFKDPDTLGNCYRYFTKTVGRDSVFYHSRSSVANDNLFNGKKVRYEISRGSNPIQSQTVNDASEKLPRRNFKIGETIIFKFCSIDYKYFLFLNSVENQISSNGNPFSSPSSIITNISGNALGDWGAYSQYTYKLSIRKIGRIYPQFSFQN